MLKLPLPTTDELRLADWLELHALLSPDRNASYVDLERTLRREGVLGLDSDEDIESIIQEVSLELELRSIAAADSYPFVIGQRIITARDPIEKFVPYIFCLCLSFVGSDANPGKRPFPGRMFEYLSCEAAKNFVDGDVVRFASPRQKNDLPIEFNLAVNELCLRIKEGVAFREKRPFSAKDDAIDIVAWRDFPDQSEGKLLLVGNCASGNNWSSKLDELQPQLFCADWMVEVPVSIHVGIRAFFVPRRIPPSDWKRVSRHAGIIFDRCRIAHWVSKTEEFRDKQHYLNWTRSVLNKIERET